MYEPRTPAPITPNRILSLAPKAERDAAAVRAELAKKLLLVCMILLV
jgi:hypothetical protein